jgi:hypothetical protein
MRLKRLVQHICRPTSAINTNLDLETLAQRLQRLQCGQMHMLTFRCQQPCQETVQVAKYATCSPCSRTTTTTRPRPPRIPPRLTAAAPTATCRRLPTATVLSQRSARASSLSSTAFQPAQARPWTSIRKRQRTSTAPGRRVLPASAATASVWTKAAMPLPTSGRA